MSADTENRPVVSLGALPLDPTARGTAYECRTGGLAGRLGLTRLGATYIEVPPGKSACPFHVHHVVDEMFVIVAGRGVYRFGDRRHEVGPGDVLGAPRGDGGFAHKLTNTGATTLKYLGISSVAEADVCEYPDSGKFSAGSPMGFGFVGRRADSVDYWDGEPDDPE